MWDFHLLAATRTIEKNTAFVLHRWLVYLGVGVAYIFGALAGAGTAVGIASLSSNPTAFANLGAWLGLILVGWLMYRFRDYFLINIKARNAALLAAKSLHYHVPKGKAQIEYARDFVAERIPQPQELTKSMHLVRRVLRNLPDFTQGQPVSALASWLRRLTGWLLTEDDLTILGYHFVQPQASVWHSVREGLLHYAASFSKLFRNRAYLFGFGWLGMIAAFPVLLVPVRNIAAALPIDPGPWPTIFALILAWTLKAAFLDSIAMAAMFELFRSLPEDFDKGRLAQELAAASPDFREIQSHAEAASSVPPGPTH
ncbi:MAG TPA: hypothetical protein VNL74_06575 [Methylococcus sp.]|nr:hypothetical protein [Methylococcus sp.]